MNLKNTGLTEINWYFSELLKLMYIVNLQQIRIQNV